MPKVSYQKDDGVEVEAFERNVSFPVNSELAQGNNVGDEVEITIKGRVSEVREEQLPMPPDEGEEEAETIRRLGVKMDSIEVYKRGDNEFEDMARDEE